jgi:uncharacterized protein
MKKFLAALALFAAGAFASSALAYTSPGLPSGYVNDFAGVLSAETKQNLESELAAFEKDTSNEITVAIVQNMGGDYIENYAVKLFEEWGVGKDARDNGALLLVAMQEREMRIEVGYGLEGALPDSLAQRILDDEMRPRLRANDTDGAVTAGVRAIEAATKGEYTPVQLSSGIPSWIFENGGFVVFGIVFVFQWLAAMLGRSKSWWLGGILGVVGGLSLGWFLALGLITMLITIGILGFFGLLFDFLVSRAYRTHVGRGATPPWWTGGGGFGGSSRGGFGGFGGGSSGGGGASSRW